jgi:hypothetical protein
MKDTVTKLLSRLLGPLSARFRDSVKNALAAELKRDLETEIAKHLENIHRHHLAFYEQLAERMGEEFLKMHHDIDSIRNAKQLALIERLDEIRRAIERMREPGPAAGGSEEPTSVRGEP